MLLWLCTLSLHLVSVRSENRVEGQLFLFFIFRKLVKESLIPPVLLLTPEFFFFEKLSTRL